MRREICRTHQQICSDGGTAMKDNSNSPVCEILCAVSLGCWILANLILIVSGDFFDLLIDITGIFTEVIPGLLLVAGYILVVIAIVRYPKSKVAGALVITYIAEIVLLFLARILLIVSCSTVN